MLPGDSRVLIQHIKELEASPSYRPGSAFHKNLWMVGFVILGWACSVCAKLPNVWKAGDALCGMKPFSTMCRLRLDLYVNVQIHAPIMGWWKGNKFSLCNLAFTYDFDVTIT